MTNKHNTTLLITGGAGFIGHHLIEGVIKNTDWDIVILDCLNYAGNLNRITDIQIYNGTYYEKLPESSHWKRIKFVWHDLRSPISDTTHKLIGDLDYVWHLAAESHVDRSLEDSIPFVMSNVVGTANLLEYLKKYQLNLKKYLYFSTDEVFGPAPEGIYFKEENTLNPSNPYSASKEGAEAISKAFAFSFGLPVVITRTMNVISERQHPEKFIPKTIQAILSNNLVKIHGIPPDISSRCWIHAREVCCALIYLMGHSEIIAKQYQFDTQHGVYHIVGEERSALDLANRVSVIIRGRKLEDKEIEFINFHSTRPGHDIRYALDGSKLLRSGFKYTMSLDQWFDKMVRWMIDDKNKRWLNL